jgi:transcriptional regulator with XRE-family HTH domain
MAETLGRRIRAARERYGMSQAELARRIGISGTALNQIESGKTPDPGVSRIIGIARVLGVNIDDLVGLYEETQTAPMTAKPRTHTPGEQAPAQQQRHVKAPSVATPVATRAPHSAEPRRP